MMVLRKGSVLKVRYLVKCTKEDEIKFIAHLDFLRTVQRIIRRAELPAEYSKGFNPHLTLSIAQPLGVGVFSSAEYFDFSLTEELDEKYIKDKLIKSCPLGIKILDVIKVKAIEGKKIPPSMALVEASDYCIHIPYEKDAEAWRQLKELLNDKQWNVIKKTKKGEKELNIRPMIKKINYEFNEGYLKLKVLVSSGSKDNLSPQILAEYIQNHTKGACKDRFVRIEREELYTYMGKKMVSLQEYFRKL